MDPSDARPYISMLQDQIDRMKDLDDARLERIERLERDRQTLRRRLEAIESTHKRGSFLRDRFAQRRPADPARGSATSSVEIPGIGTIAEPSSQTSPPRRSLRVATILDAFTHLVLAPEFISVPLHARDWRNRLESDPPDLLFVESAFSGLEDSWATRIARLASPSRQLLDVVEWCRNRSIPTIFWNKEDPINFDWFIQSARLFDIVLTVDRNLLDTYRDVLGHGRVGCMPFFAQPAIHHPPANDTDRIGDVAFAGSYYAAKHAARRAQIEFVVDPARRYGLHIFDRHGRTDDPRFAWPDRFKPHIMGSLTYLQTVEAYRRYKVFLNVNTVTNSPSMCARRVFELAACGTPIITGPARAIDEMVPSGAVLMVESAGEADAALRELLNDGRRETMSQIARSWVLENHTAEKRIDELLERV